MTNTDFCEREIDVEDIDPDDPERNVTCAQEEIEECASAVSADVTVEFLRMDGITAVFHVSGHYLDMERFTKRWEDEYV